MSASIRSLSALGFIRCEDALDRLFGDRCNPLRHLGALAFYCFWILAASGIYLYIVMETSVEGAHRSIAELSGRGFGGLLRSFHRYGSACFLLTVSLHLLREWALGRYRGFRWYSWISGVPLVWLMFASAIGGYWLPWDRLAQYSAVATTEWLDWFPIFTEPTARNFQSPGAVTDRLFTLLVFLHIGIPLLTILGAWAHVHRISRVDHFPARPLAWSLFLALLALALISPATSGPAADLKLAVASVQLDWFALFIHPLSELLGHGPTWALLFGTTALLCALPWLDRTPAAPAAVVDAPNCNGCRRCYDDCPYGAVMMLPHPDKARREIAVVDAEYCASCGICVGACPSSTPFRRQETLITGIDLPHSPINAWRQRLEDWLAQRPPATGRPRIVLFGCDCAAPVARLADDDTLVLSLACSGMLPPAFIDYALRSGADGIMVSGCQPGSCAFRFGSRWTEARLAGARAPELRREAARDHLRVVWADAHQLDDLSAALARLRAALGERPISSVLPVFRRRSALHVKQQP